MVTKRLQLTLFVDKKASEAIEKIRQTFNPLQYELIKSHVTLCREDELESLEKVIANLEKLNHDPITIHFGKAARFADGKGVFLPAIGDNAGFQQLRAQILQGIIDHPRTQEPHITLIHPRNGTCTDAIFEHIEQCSLPDTLSFSTISWIEQEVGREWRVVRALEMNKIYNS
jgi:2'-5' RNA ligase